VSFSAFIFAWCSAFFYFLHVPLLRQAFYTLVPWESIKKTGIALMNNKRKHPHVCTLVTGPYGDETEQSGLSASVQQESRTLCPSWR